MILMCRSTKGFATPRGFDSRVSLIAMISVVLLSMLQSLYEMLLYPQSQHVIVK